MALADFYGRNALAAAQVLNGFDEARIRSAVEKAIVGVVISKQAAECHEGEALLDLLTRLIARLYPKISIRGDAGSDNAVQRTIRLARDINPDIEFSAESTVDVLVGQSATSTAARQVFVGSEGWNAFVGIEHPYSVGSSNNPFGAGVAACLAAANVFRWVFLGSNADLDRDTVVSVLEAEPRRGTDASISGSLGDIVLVGAGAIGNSVAWALSRQSMSGVLHVVDNQTIDLGNLQRYVLAERCDVDKVKGDVVARHFGKNLKIEPHHSDFAEFVAENGYRWSTMLLALDSASDRRAAQGSLPRWIANAWTQPGDLGVSSHDFLDGACVACLYLPDRALESEDAVVATALGLRDQVMQVRTLLHTGAGVPRSLLDTIASSLTLPIERLLPFEGQPIRALYTEGFCGGAVIPLGAAGTPRKETHVPLAHQSALAGVLLAAAAVRHVLAPDSSGSRVTRIDVMRSVGTCLTQSTAKDPRGLCICQDPDYRDLYQSKYPQPVATTRTRR